MKFSEFVELIRKWIGFVNGGIIVLLTLLVLFLLWRTRKLKKQYLKIFSKINDQQRMINNNIELLDEIKAPKTKKPLLSKTLNVELNKLDKKKEKVKGKKEKEMIDLEKKGKIFQEKVKKVVAKEKNK